MLRREGKSLGLIVAEVMVLGSAGSSSVHSGSCLTESARRSSGLTCANSFLWEPATGVLNVNDPNTVLTPTVSTTYKLNFIDNFGCVATDTLSVTVIDPTTLDCVAYLANAFTPNGDGTNDYFSFNEYGMTSVEALIYNRWGELVYSWKTLNQDWDGRGIDGEELPEGVYYYVLNATGEDGYSYTKKGSITLLR